MKGGFMTYKGFRNALIVCGCIAAILAILCGFQAKRYYEYSINENLIEIQGIVESYQDGSGTGGSEIILKEYNNIFYCDTNIEDLVDRHVLEREIEKPYQCTIQIQIFAEDARLLTTDSSVEMQKITINGKECLKWSNVKHRYQIIGVCFLLIMIFALCAMVYLIYCVTGKRYRVVTY